MVRRAFRREVSADLYGMTGYGKTARDAKADVERRLTEAMEGFYTIGLWRFPAGYIGMVSRSPHSGWGYAILGPTEDFRHGVSCSGITSCDEAERQLRRHVAQNLIFVVGDNGLSVILDERDRRDHAEYIAWQVRYKEYRAQGYSDTDSHRMACESRAFCPTT